MAFMEVFFEKDWSIQTLKHNWSITRYVKIFLTRVYFTLFCTLAASAMGMYLHILFKTGGIIKILAFIVCVLWFSRVHYWLERKKFTLLMAAALSGGASVGYLLELVLKIDLRAIVSALVGAALVAGSFSASARWSEPTIEDIYGYGMLYSAISCLSWLNSLLFASSIFDGSIDLLAYEKIGLLLFVVFTVLDSQAIIRQAYYGDVNYVKHALTLIFTDFPAILIHPFFVLKGRLFKRRKVERHVTWNL